jgi:hypothetical protein
MGCFGQGQKMAPRNGSGTFASASITFMTIDSNTAYVADVCKLLEVGCVPCYRHLVCNVDSRHICTPSV